MKPTLLFIALLSALLSSAQTKLTTYQASNGITYNIGDTIWLGRGSGMNAKYVYIQASGMTAALAGPDATGLGPGYSGHFGILKKIMKQDDSGKILFTAKIAMSNFWIYLDDAIATCEITPCAATTPHQGKDKYQLLIDLKKLLNDSIITQQEFDSEKKKILAD